MKKTDRKTRIDLRQNHRFAVLFWVLSVICMGAIFWFSSRTADESTEQSNVFVAWFYHLFGANEIWVFIVRKAAHCLEFCGLALLFSGAWGFTKGRLMPLAAVGCASLYAVTDEIHQIFVEGRSCELRDWAIDTFGAVAGVLAFYILARIISVIIKKKQHTKP